jgi:LEA14-like dessication related protein
MVDIVVVVENNQVKNYYNREIMNTVETKINLK